MLILRTLWLVAIIPTMIIAMTALYDGVISLGEIIAIAITLTIAGIALLAWWIKRRQSQNSFSLELPSGTYDDPGPILKSQELSLSVHDVLVRIRVKSKLDIREINFRFFKERKGNEEANTEDIKILNVWERELEHQQQTGGFLRPIVTTFSSAEDTLGGYDGYYGPPFSKSANSYLWYRVIVGTYKPTMAYLSFQCEGANGYRQSDRKKFEIVNIMPSILDTQDGQP